MLDLKSHSNVFARFGRTVAWTPVKCLGGALVISSLAACGGGSDGEGDGASPNPGGDDGAKTMTVQALPGARLDSEETAILLAPGSLFYQTVGMTQGVLSTFDPLAGYDQADQDTPCDRSGQIRVVDINEHAAVESPYSGSLYKTVTTDDQGCLNGGDQDGGLGLQVFTNGVRTIGRPNSGMGAVGDEDAFIAYEQSGRSEAEPFTVRMSEGEDLMFGWARLWSGHVMLHRGSGEDSAMGDGGGYSELFQLSTLVTGDGEEEMQFRLQIGQADQALNYAYHVAEGKVPSEAREESFSGAFGRQWDSMSGQTVPASCPGGRVNVTTDGLDVRALPEGEDGILMTSDEVWLGQVTLADDFENEAVVTYDGQAKSVSVSLNGQIGKVFSYDDINTLFMERCLPLM